jgi:hypothetical protein
MSRYSEVSKRIMSVFRQYDPNMLAASVDEAYLKQVSFSSTRLGNEGEPFLSLISIPVSRSIACSTTWIQTNVWGGYVSGFLMRQSSRSARVLQRTRCASNLFPTDLLVSIAALQMLAKVRCSSACQPHTILLYTLYGPDMFRQSSNLYSLTGLLIQLRFLL